MALQRVASRGETGSGATGLVWARQGTFMDERKQFQPSYTRIAIQDRMAAMGVGDVVSYQDLCEIAGKNHRIEKDLRHVQQVCHGVRWRLLKEKGFYIDNVENVGYKRLSAEESVGASESFVGKIRRSAKKASKIAAAVDYDSLPKELQTRHNIILAKTATVLHFTSSATTRKIESQVVKNQGAIPILETLESFRGS
jgi:hypothetical protein